MRIVAPLLNSASLEAHSPTSGRGGAHDFLPGAVSLEERSERRLAEIESGRRLVVDGGVPRQFLRPRLPYGAVAGDSPSRAAAGVLSDVLREWRRLHAGHDLSGTRRDVERGPPRTPGTPHLGQLPRGPRHRHDGAGTRPLLHPDPLRLLRRLALARVLRQA